MTTINDPAASRDADVAGSGGQVVEGKRAAAAQLLRLMRGIRISRCVYAVAVLGIADLLADGPSNSQELALATGSDEPSRIARHPQIRDYQVQQTAAGAAIAIVADASVDADVITDHFMTALTKGGLTDPRIEVTRAGTIPRTASGKQALFVRRNAP